MPVWSVAVLVGIAAVALVGWSLSSHQARRRAQIEALDQLGFRPCPEEAGHLEQTVREIENNRGYQYEIREPRRISGEQPIYYYVKSRRKPSDDAPPLVEEEILFQVQRSAVAGLVLVVKPSSIPAGVASKILGSLATGPWDANPDDLKPLEIPPDLRDTNLVGALGPPGARLYDLLDGSILSVAQSLGDAGGMFIRFRGPWCAAAGASAQIPFRVQQIVAGVRPILSRQSRAIA